VAALTALDRTAAIGSVQRCTTTLIDSLSLQEWRTPSAATGWSVLDVVAHMSSGLHDMFGTLMLQVARSTDIEAMNEQAVGRRRDWAPEAVAAEYRRWAPRARIALRATQFPVLSRIRVPMAELGGFPMWSLASAVVFDTHTHLRHDIAPVISRPVPPAEPVVLSATVEWMMLVAANMGTAAVPMTEGRAVRFSFTGPGAGEWLLRRDGRKHGKLSAAPWDGTPSHVTISTAAADFPVWGTHRRPWRDYPIDIHGDTALGVAVLDTLRVV
jgi:hypothetical protein